MHTKAMQIVYLLFEDIKYRQEDNKYKPLHEIQKLVAERFKEITGLTAPHSDFLSVSIKEKTQRYILKLSTSGAHGPLFPNVQGGPKSIDKN